MSRIDDQPAAQAPQPSTPTHAHAAHEHHGLARAVRAVFSVTLLSRVGGLIRDVIVARIFGDTVVNSAFQTAFAIPNMFRRLFGEGALSAAFIPEYAAAEETDRAAADRLASLTIWWLGLATGVLTVLIEIVLLALLVLLPADPERELSFKLIMVMLPFMPLICIVAILAGMLQVHGRFAASSTGPLVLNTFMVVVGAAAIWNGRVLDVTVAYIFGVATTLSGLTQAIWFARLLRPHVRWTGHTAAARPQAAVMLKRFGPVLLGLGTLQFNAFLDQLLAMWSIWVGPTMLGFAYPLDGKSAGILVAAQRLYQFPLGVFGIAVATAVFPMLARDASDPARFGATLRRGLRLSLLLGLPASIGLMLVREDLTHVLYAGRAAAPTANINQAATSGFSAEGLARAAAALMGYAPAVWAYSLNHVLTRAFYARGDTMTPMRVSMALVVVNVGCNLALIWPLREAGLAWSSCITATLQFLVLAMLLKRVPGGNIATAETFAGAVWIVLAAAVMTGACLAVMHFWPAPGTLWMHAARLATVCTVGIATFGASCLALGVQELRWLAHRGTPTPA